MSGIVGIVSTGAAIPDEVARHVHSALASWGIDGSGTWGQAGAYLGHHQLRDVPESDTQPVWDAADQLALVSDARLDNREELCATLEVPVERQPTLPDSALILAAWKRWDVRCPEYLLGDFAFALWDVRRRRLFLARDPLGVKPLYYHSGPRLLVFASDVKGVLGHPDVSHSYDRAFLSDYLRNPTFERLESTFFAGVRKLPPAHHLTFADGVAHSRRYWDPRHAPELRLSNDEAYAERMRELVEAAVACRLRAAAPIGVHLSGGLDSSAIAVLAARQLARSGGSPIAYSWSPPPPSGPLAEQDERRRVEMVARQEGVECRYAERWLHEVARLAMLDPAREPTTMAQLEFKTQEQAAADGVGILLSGWGGDEFATFNGRGHLAAEFLRGHWPSVWRECRSAAARSGGRPIEVFRARVVRPILPVQGGRIDGPERHYAHPSIVRDFPPRPTAREGIGGRANMELLLGLGHLGQRTEDWARLGAPRGIAYRYPLLDRRLVEFCFSLPPRLFHHLGFTRYVFRKAFADILPTEIVWGRPKRETAIDRTPVAADAPRSELLAAVRERAARPQDIVDADRLLHDWSRPETVGVLRSRAVQCLFLA